MKKYETWKSETEQLTWKSETKQGHDVMKQNGGMMWKQVWLWSSETEHDMQIWSETGQEHKMKQNKDMQWHRTRTWSDTEQGHELNRTGKQVKKRYYAKGVIGTIKLYKLDSSNYKHQKEQRKVVRLLI